MAIQRKTALLQVADTGPLESLVVMLQSVGYDCFLPSDRLKNRLRSWGCDTVLDVSDLVRGWGYEQPMSIPESHDLFVDLYVDVKAHRNGPIIWQRQPRLKERTL